jgi:hypothetical protein
MSFVASLRHDRRSKDRVAGPADTPSRTRRRWPRVPRSERRVVLRELSFPAGERAPEAAQAAVTEVVRERVDPATAEDIRVLVGELVTRRIAQRPRRDAETVSLTLLLLPRVLHVELEDPNCELDLRSLLPRPVPDLHDGWQTVGALASRWGVRPASPAIWFELDRPRRAARLVTG